jgi:hypothetical protein
VRVEQRIQILVSNAGVISPMMQHSSNLTARVAVAWALLSLGACGSEEPPSKAVRDAEVSAQRASQALRPPEVQKTVPTEPTTPSIGNRQ